jgi:hypothetical protein
LDGRISEQEWSGAYKQQLSGGGEISLLHDGTDLFIGVSGSKDGWAHVYVSENEQIHVLHASAALGKAVYKRSNAGSWQPVQGFDWALRQTDRSEETEKARSAYFDAQGWLANNNLTGSGNVLEFKVGSRYIKAGGLKVAVVYSSDGKSLQYWPSSLNDDCLKPELVTGETPSDLKFNQSTWASLVITQK